MLEKITLDDIDVGVEAVDWKDAIRKSSAYLLSTKKIKESYVEAMIDGVLRLGPYIVLGNHVALAHARPECGVNELSVHFTTLKPFIPFGSKKFDPVSLIITLAAENADSHLDLISELADILIDENNVTRLSLCKTKEEFLSLLKEFQDA